MLTRFYDYLQYELNRAPLTVEAYKTDIDQFCNWLSPKNPDIIDFKSVTSNDVRAWIKFLAKGGNTPRTIRRKIISLRTLFKWMVKAELISRSPLREVTLPKINKPLPDVIKPEEIEKLLIDLTDSPESQENVENKKNEFPAILKSLIIEILYSMGLRRAELISLNDSDISFSQGEIKVTGKRSKQRIIPVPQKLLIKIKEWQNVRDKDVEMKGQDSPLFLIKGKRISQGQVYSIVHQALLSTSARKKSPHALRHTFASGMLNGGADIDSVREFLGHASLATTQIYTHISLNEIKKAYSSSHPRSSEIKK